MYLKKLTLAGFKSFADPTEFQFHPGTTAVVGPNGCGKSNVVDAFRWVLGERSAKELRGQEMMDVIFKGTSTRAPVGRAEVSLLFDNGDAKLDIACAEVEVTRRLYRSGESEYLLNNRRCRLKDVRALFADTGIGVEGYSILEQGAVDAFLHANPEERRAIFEEAAGISRFKQQTAQSLRQLERVEANLARLGDILQEVERQVRSVKIQAGKARRFLEDRETLLRLRCTIAAVEIERQRTEREAMTFELELLGVRQELLREVAARLANDDAAARRAAEQANLALAALREDELKQRMESERIGQRRRHIEEQRAEIEAASSRRAEQLAELAVIEAEYGNRRAEVRASLRGELTSLRAIRTEFDEQDAERKSIGEEKGSAERALRTLREEALSHLVSETRLNNERTTLDAEERGLGARAARRAQEGEEFRREAAGVEAAIAESEARRGAVRLASEEATKQAALLQEEISRRAELQGETERTLEDLRGRCRDHEARLRSREELEKNREGVSRGARRLLASEHPLGRDVLGLLAESIDAPPEIAPLVDAVLGAYCDTVVIAGGTPTADQARVLSQVLDGEGVTFCPTVPASRAAALSAAAAEAGEPLVGLISCEPIFRPLLDRVFGNVRVVDDLPRALELRAAAPNGCRYVTRDGALVEPWGAITLPGKDGRRGLVSRQSEIKFLRVELAGRRRDLALVAEQATALEGDIAARSEELRQAVERVHRGRMEEENFGRRMTELTRDRARVADRLRVVESELAEISESRRRVEGARAALAVRLAEIGAERRRLDAGIAEGEERSERAEENLRELEARISQLRVRATQKEERILALRREELRIAGEVGERGERRRWLETEAGRDAERLRAFVEEECGLDGEEQDLARSLEALAAKVARVEEEALVRKGQLQEAEELESLARTEEDAVREARERALVRENECRVLIGALRDKITEEFQADLAALPVGEWRRAASVEGEEKETFLERLRAAVEETQERLRRNASVNLEAVNELAALEEREAHLRAQIADVDDAKQKLLSTIDSLNATSRQLFADTFELIRRNFQELFAKVFNGGEADLCLEAEKDVLEAGVDVIARPPGKRITSLKLLSGGEKALTAIAVLFALFRHKPSPFCVLDEVDAPLDESNTRRFVRMLKEFNASTQFLVITHSKVTMAEAERLYGVTMEERGVSRQVAVRLEEAEALGAAAPPAAAAPEIAEVAADTEQVALVPLNGEDEDVRVARRLASRLG